MTTDNKRKFNFTVKLDTEEAIVAAIQEATEEMTEAVSHMNTANKHSEEAYSSLGEAIEAYSDLEVESVNIKAAIYDFRLAADDYIGDVGAQINIHSSINNYEGDTTSAKE